MHILEWQRRAAKQFIEKAALTEEKAVEFAILAHDNYVEDGADEATTPEEWVDEELSCWTDDII